jgi:SAM-dependent methyltransferase
VPLLGEAVGTDEPGDSRPDDRDLHGADDSLPGVAPLEPTASAVCCCCGGLRLRPHFAVAAETDPAEGLIPTTTAFGTAMSNIVRCDSCGHMQLETMPADERLAELYEEAESTDYVEEEAGQRHTANEILARVERFGAPGRMLDLGCWVGFLLSEAQRRGWETVGVEPSEWASTFARERLGLDVRRAELFAAELEPNAYDAVFLGDVIEHLPRPDAALARIRELLVADGVLAMALPDAGSRLARVMGKRWWAVAPTHVQYFTRASLGTLLARCGFEPLLWETQPKSFTVRYYLDRIGGYSRPTASGLVRAATALRLADRMWAPDFGDRMLVIARSRG